MHYNVVQWLKNKKYTILSISVSLKYIQYLFVGLKRFSSLEYSPVIWLNAWSDKLIGRTWAVRQVYSSIPRHLANWLANRLNSRFFYILGYEHLHKPVFTNEIIKKIHAFLIISPPTAIYPQLKVLSYKFSRVIASPKAADRQSEWTKECVREIEINK